MFESFTTASIGCFARIRSLFDVEKAFEEASTIGDVSESCGESTSEDELALRD